MHRTRPDVLAALTCGAALVFLAACGEAPSPQAPTAPADGAEARAPAVAAPNAKTPVAAAPTQTVVATGLLFPRGIAFDNKGALYVAEAGTIAGNTISTAGRCTQVAPPVGPRLGGATSRISRIENGTRTTIASGIPSTLNAMGAVEGAADLAFVGNKLYAIIVGGCSRGLADSPGGVYRIEDGGWTLEADITAFVHANPVAAPNLGDFEPDGDPYSMVAAGGVLYVAEANSGQLLQIKPNPGRVERLADVSATQGHVVPTAIAVLRDDILVGELRRFPAVPGTAEILRYSRNGRLEGTIGGFTSILGLDADNKGNLYVLEPFTCATAAPCFPSPASGRVTRVAPDGTRTVLATGLSFATSLRLGPDGALYVSNGGFGPPGAGEIVRITF